MRAPAFLTLGLCALLAALSPALAAQTPVLSGAKLSPAPGGGAELLLTFAPRIPAFTVAGENTAEVDFTFTGATLGAAPQLGAAGPVKTVVFRKTPTGFSMHLALSGGNALGVNRSGSSLDLLIAGVAAPPALRMRTPASGTSAGALRGITEVVPLKYADVSEVAGIFSDVPVAEQSSFSRPASIFGLPQAAYGGSYGSALNPLYAAPTPEPAQGQRVTPNLAIDRRLNAAVLTGSPRAVATLRALIARIDVPAPMVELQCDVVELTQTGAANAGLDFNSSGAFASASMLAGSGAPPLTVLNLQARILGEIRKGNGHLLGAPRVTAPSGELVTLIDGTAVPVVSSHVLGGTPPVIQEDVAYVNVGVHLDIQPRVSSDRTVTSHIFAEFSNVTAQKSGPEGRVPQVTLRQTATTATALDGQPFLIGGFAQFSDETTYTRTPVLGHLPLIGGLFRIKRHTRGVTNLYIMITPRVLPAVGPPGGSTSAGSATSFR